MNVCQKCGNSVPDLKTFKLESGTFCDVCSVEALLNERGYTNDIGGEYKGLVRINKVERERSERWKKRYW